MAHVSRQYLCKVLRLSGVSSNETAMLQRYFHLHPYIINYLSSGSGMCLPYIIISSSRDQENAVHAAFAIKIDRLIRQCMIQNTRHTRYAVPVLHGDIKLNNDGVPLNN